MQKEEAIRAALALANRSGIAMLGTNGDNGYPNIKAMIKMENEGLNRIWFSTNHFIQKGRPTCPKLEGLCLLC